MARDSHRTNHQIRVREVRLVGDNVENGVFSRDEALKLAENLDLDLVEISPNAKPPVCKIIDYSKFKYEQKKREKELKAKASKTVVKEIRFGPNTDQHDLDFKTKHAVKFLNDGNKVKAYVHFHGRTIIYKDRGRELLQRFAEKIQEHGKIEGQMRVEGRRMIMFISPNVPKK
ncbi:translation initiation factor IF-3 [Flammeovirga yaeyamensis]|uniref:Translation initiation factor IF-3 n=1 Tax=Flammeovirga yaeyamensis TaxID=367791 RepID=A0AAX1N9F0_9BACT|nr:MULTISPECIES: translation initiation factor IF-3 [Flammeovirga]ANQ48737.1 translation initiation factor IF-3 [Flammeovirga sp. MY04]MBB3698815.1 translation initiation factor IF-3 [Flammeovirga yaeyamensis]NMF37400.1 translation initiation factor IF-3 [Flammeovirga yaeyamensis]QWG03786.1 translation initiation factor IF-3 [Flammeovirga yaeyamensis]